MTNRAAVFIDGGYFSRVLREEFALSKIDFKRLSESVVGTNSELFRSYYYNCLPYQSAPPTADESRMYGNMRRFIDALENLPRFEIRLGKLEKRGIDPLTLSPIFQQKRVDIMLGVDLVLLAAKQRIDQAVLITGDSDFIPAVKVAKDEGVTIHLFHGDRASVHNEIWQAADERTQFSADFIKSITKR